TAETQALSLHDALPILGNVAAVAKIAPAQGQFGAHAGAPAQVRVPGGVARHAQAVGRVGLARRYRTQAGTQRPARLQLPVQPQRSEEHTSELQSRENLV